MSHGADEAGDKIVGAISHNEEEKADEVGDKIVGARSHNEEEKTDEVGDKIVGARSHNEEEKADEAGDKIVWAMSHNGNEEEKAHTLKEFPWWLLLALPNYLCSHPEGGGWTCTTMHQSG